MLKHVHLMVPLLFLTACTDPIPVSVKNSPYVLRGEWSGPFQTPDPVKAQATPAPVVMVWTLSAQYVNQDTYRFEGTAKWGEQQWKVTGTGSGTLIEFKQATPAELRAQGTLQDLQGNNVADFQCGRAALFPGTEVPSVTYICQITGKDLNLSGQLGKTQ